MVTDSKTEEARNRYKPNNVSVLFVGESAPAGGTFFYFGNSGFTSYTRQAFENGLGLRFESNMAFLDLFKKSGCWLDDISLIPVNGLVRKKRTSVLEEQTPEFAQRLEETNPDYLIVSLKSIIPYVDAALRQVSVRPKVHYLPFPGNGHQRKYMDQLAKILIVARSDGVIAL